MKVVRLIPLLCLASLCFAQYNFQERVIWYGPDEYACKKHFGEDTIDLIMHFN